MKIIVRIFLWITLIVFFSCIKDYTAKEIIQRTIKSIDEIETIYYKQDMSRTNPRNINDTISRYREMYFKRLISDSIVGVKGHWYMYVNDKEKIIYEDIYDGNKLIRKNNRDSVARIYDLIKYPSFKNTPFWGHNTLYGMQYELKFILENTDSYSIQRLDDSIFNNIDCYHILIGLENKSTMPGFMTKLEKSEGNISHTSYFIDKKTNYPVRLFSVNYSSGNSGQKFFIEQNYYDIKFNIEIDEQYKFNTSPDSLKGFEKIEMKP